jgi:hypothetical protein
MRWCPARSPPAAEADRDVEPRPQVFWRNACGGDPSKAIF